MLTVDLSQLTTRPLEWEELVPEPETVWDEPGLAFRGPLRARLRAERLHDGGVQVVGRLRCEVQLACRRCLAPVAEVLAIPLRLWYREDAGEGCEDDAVFAIERGATAIDLGPAIREELLLAVPPYPLCREDCPGICPGCGAERARGECGCATDEPDPRWEVLRALSQRLQPGS